MENMMSGFLSFKKEIEALVNQVVSDPIQHGLWLNTLSYLENCGARKIASCEHPNLVKEEVLKHAAEEFRHAFYLKTQLNRIDQKHVDYRFSSLIAARSAHRFIHALDISICRFLRRNRKSLCEIRAWAYVLVTYAIELRAGELYPIYQAALRDVKSKVQVQSILLEEKEHLLEMEEELKVLNIPESYIEMACQIEGRLFSNFLEECITVIKY